jgi:mannose-6-phosphate isomerase-like protein (cupin superfamily)
MSSDIKDVFPDFVRRLPEADYSADGAGTIRGYILQGSEHQVVFNENDEPVTFTPHQHGASFGVVLQGECELVIDGQSSFYRAGDVYYVPANVTHFARQSANYKDIVIFDQSDRVPVSRRGG